MKNTNAFGLTGFSVIMAFVSSMFVGHFLNETRQKSSDAQLFFN